jgi:hypothetical protein
MANVMPSVSSIVFFGSGACFKTVLGDLVVTEHRNSVNL